MKFFKSYYFHFLFIVLLLLPISIFSRNPDSPVNLTFCNISLFLFLIFSVQHGWSISYKAGFISGMIYDLSCGTFGVFMLIFTVLGFAAGHLKGKLFFGKLIFPFLASFLLVIYKSLMLGFLYLISGKSDFVPLGSILNILIELGMTIATGMILYFILSVTRIIDLNSKEYIL